MANKDYNFQYTPLTGRLPGNSFVKQTEQAINELAGIVNEGAAQVEVITNLANQANDNSEEALEKATEALETSGRVYITLPNLDDADDYFDSQLYYFANSYSHNLPVQDTGFLEVKTNDTKTAAEQVFVADTTGLMYMRHGVITSSEVGGETVYSVTWETWSSALASESYVQGELVNYLPLSGGTITGNLVTSNSVNVKSGSVAPVNTLQRSTAYAVGDIVYSGELNAKYFLKCTTAGTTDVTEPSFAGAESGTIIADGTAEFTVQTVLSLEDNESQFIDNLIAKLQDTTAILPAGTAFTAATLLSKIISNMNTEDGVQYNFSSSNAWYIKLGAKYGGLIIQGGLADSPNNPQVKTLPISYPNANYVCVIVTVQGNTISTVKNANVAQKTASQFTMAKESAGAGCDWITFGF